MGVLSCCRSALIGRVGVVGVDERLAFPQHCDDAVECMLAMMVKTMRLLAWCSPVDGAGAVVWRRCSYRNGGIASASLEREGSASAAALQNRFFMRFPGISMISITSTTTTRSSNDSGLCGW